MNLVPSAPRSVDTPALSKVPVPIGTPRGVDGSATPAPPAFLTSLAALVAQVERGPEPVRPALELSRLTVTRMAEELGIPRATLAAYRLGTRRMPAAGRARLGAYLAAHAEALSRVARALAGGGPEDGVQGADAPGDGPQGSGVHAGHACHLPHLAALLQGSSPSADAHQAGPAI